MIKAYLQQNGLFAILACLFLSTANAWQIEVQDVTVDPNNYTTVLFQQAFEPTVTPVVMMLTDGNIGGPNNDEPAVVRIRAVTSVGFQFAVVEPTGADGTYDTPVTLSYMAVEPGVHEFPNGFILQAGTASFNTVQHGSGFSRFPQEAWTRQTYAQPFNDKPALVTMPQTTNNERNNSPGEVSVVWVTTAVKGDLEDRFDWSNERSEANTQPLFFNFINETHGYVAVDDGAAGSFDDRVGNPVLFEAFRSADRVQGWDDGCNRTFPQNTGFVNNYNALPKVFAGMMTHGNGNGGWIRRCSLTTDAVGLIIDEDQDRDSERNIGSERAGVIVFNRNFVADIGADPVGEAMPRIKKTVAVDSDPINQGNNPKAIPTSELIYTIRVENFGEGAGENIQIDDAVPANMDLYINNTENCGSVVFRNGTPTSGLTCTVLGVSYDDGSGNYNYAPEDDGTGFDPLASAIRINFTGQFAGCVGVPCSTPPNFEVDLRMRLQ